MILEYRAIQSEDFPTIAKWNVELHEDEGSVPMAVSDAEIRLQRWFASGRFGGAVFTSAGDDIGYLVHETLAPDPDLRGAQGSLYIRQFFIVRNKRRNGLGRAAFHLFQHEVNQMHLPVVLDVKATNPDAHKFWSALGFDAQHTNFKLQVSQ